MGPAPLTGTLSRWDVFKVFFKAGCALGGGPGIMAALEEELVRKRRVVTAEDFLSTYALGRIVPSGTMTAVAVAYGFRFGGWAGTVGAIVGLVLPALSLTLLLTAGYAALQNGPVLSLLSATLLPSALAFIVVAALRFGKEVFRPSFDLMLASAAAAGTLVWDVHPSVLLLAGGVVGVLAFRRPGGK
jgi:chromate transporter